MIRRMLMYSCRKVALMNLRFRRFLMECPSIGRGNAFIAEQQKADDAKENGEAAIRKCRNLIHLAVTRVRLEASFLTQGQTNIVRLSTVSDPRN